SQQPEGWYLIFGRIFTIYYFAFFLVVMPLTGWIERPRALPGSITESVLGPQASVQTDTIETEEAKAAPPPPALKQKREEVL
ncbi:MAG: hypothetical protein JJE37_05405, partial [Methyloceanibacter sp.]|nr:hypothetical protein [Methyloceanibacter sp.]